MEVSARYYALSVQIKAAEKRMAEIAALRKHIINYSKTRDVYVAYRKEGYSKKFYEENTAELLLHKVAKQAFDELNTKELPTVKSLNAEYAELLSTKKKAFTEYGNARAEMREVLTVKANVESILEYDKNKVSVKHHLTLTSPTASNHQNATHKNPASFPQPQIRSCSTIKLHDRT